MNLILIAIITLGAIGALSAVILFFAAKKFAVFEDLRIAQIEEALPAANCGGCGNPGCHAFAEACVNAEDFSKMYCPVGGTAVMSKVAAILGKEAKEAIPMIAVVRCNGTCAYRPRTNVYDGAASCAVVSALYGGDTDCSYGCLGCGDCEDVCQFDAIHMNPETRLPEVVEETCVACGACVKACPKSIIELRKKGPKSRRIFVSCVNKDKGALSKKACEVSCIACGKCEKVCEFNAITIESNLAYIDYNKCRLCRKCVEVCPTSAIHELNFPAKKVEMIEAVSLDERD